MGIRRHVYYSGAVQGVGFRYAAARAAEGRAVAGFVRNLRDGRVELVAEGQEAEVSGLLAEIDGLMAGYVRARQVVDEPVGGEFRGFEVRATR